MRSRAFIAVLVGAGALALHELRYLVIYHHEAHEALAVDGHDYLALVTPLVAAAMALSLAPLLRRWAGGHDAVSGPAWSGRRLWAGATVCLLAVYVAQEWLEGLLIAEHPAGLAGVFGAGGWSAVLLAALLGALVSLAARATGLAAAGVTSGALRRTPLPRPLLIPLPIGPDGPPADAVASFLAGRGPPAFR